MIVIRLYRIGNLLHRKSWFRLAKLVSYLNRFLFAVWLPSSAKIGRNFKLGYGGDNVLIAQNVTIGRNFGDKKVPVIGNDVYIGTGSVIFGEITIGNNVIIGSNTLVNKSIPDNTTVVGNPMKIIQSYRIKKYYELDTKTDPCKKTVLKNH